jgi:hypothetical protein
LFRQSHLFSHQPFLDRWLELTACRRTGKKTHSKLEAF